LSENTNAETRGIIAFQIQDFPDSNIREMSQIETKKNYETSFQIEKTNDKSIY
jgi:hypothetical protein